MARPYSRLSGQWRPVSVPSFHTLRNSKPVHESLWPKRAASGLRKKTAPRRATFLNDFFTYGRRFFWKTSWLFGYSLHRQTHPKAPTAGSATSPLLRLARCARVIPRSRSTSGLSHLGRGVFPPPVHPPGPRALPLRNPPPLRGVYARIAPWPGLAPGPVPYAPCRPAGLTCRPRAHHSPSGPTAQA